VQLEGLIDQEAYNAVLNKTWNMEANHAPHMYILSQNDHIQLE
jgi:hypothetical protein